MNEYLGIENYITAGSDLALLSYAQGIYLCRACVKLQLMLPISILLLKLLS